MSDKVCVTLCRVGNWVFVTPMQDTCFPSANGLHITRKTGRCECVFCVFVTRYILGIKLYYHDRLHSLEVIAVVAKNQ